MIRHFLQNPLFESTLHQCKDVTFATLERCGWIKIFHVDSLTANNNNNKSNNNTSKTQSCLQRYSMYTTPIPLAKIVAQIKRSLQHTFYSPVVSKLPSSYICDSTFPNACTKAMISMDIVLELSHECMHLYNLFVNYLYNYVKKDLPWICL